jgi:FkbM family methyltransferase
MKNYSQNDEQEVILKYFGDFKGRFLDIGAYNGVDLSNTWALLELGWQGTFIEPNPFNLVDLIKNVEPFADRAEVICAGVFSPSLRTLHLDRSPGRGWGASFTTVNPPIDPSPLTVCVPCIGSMFGGMADMISIDAEGDDLHVLAVLADQYYLKHCKLLVIEAQDRPKTYKAFEDYGFSVHHETPENIIAVRR